ncbi:mitotic apparatus protein p62-like [Diadema antillarum]|uniref:mitotic apparatus protein p62-like n=1 Tax=Diadema antillarum TaxID=105358 RepID=UPI003A895139
MAKEYFWGAKLSKDKRIFKWDPEAEYADDEDDDDSIVHFLFLKQAVLGSGAKEGERNIIEVETVNFDGEPIKQPLLSLKAGLNESAPLDIGLQPPVTFRLSGGNGPVFLSGQHALDLQEDEDFGKDFKDDEDLELEAFEDEEEEDEEEEEEGADISASPNLKPAPKGKDNKKAAAAAKASAKVCDLLPSSLCLSLSQAPF